MATTGYGSGVRPRRGHSVHWVRVRVSDDRFADRNSSAHAGKGQARRDTQPRIREYELRDLVGRHHQARDRQRMKKTGLHVERQDDLDGIVGSAHSGQRRLARAAKQYGREADGKPD